MPIFDDPEGTQRDMPSVNELTEELILAKKKTWQQKNYSINLVLQD